VIVLAASSVAPTTERFQRLYEVLLRLTSEDPTPVSEMLGRVVRECQVDRDEIVAAMWDLVEDGELAYDGAARIRRSA